MTDIPVGSPPAPPGRHAAPGGWYPDPTDPSKERYWDGWQWSRNTRAAEGPSLSSAGPAPYGQVYGGGYPPAPQQAWNAPATRMALARTSATADGVPLASWWWRALAVILDSVIMSFIAAIPGIPIYAKLFRALAEMLRQTMQASRAGQPPPPVPNTADLVSAGDQLILSGIAVVVGLLYYAIFLRWKAATPGKLICGLRVVPVDQGRNRAPLSWNCILVRVLIWILPGAYSPLLIVKVLDSLFPLWQPKRQALHDLAARTQVVRVR
jgi:uncharacterized RDD family membrane protein YckC